MGRGRQKAKQTKVARELKYYSPETDYAKLQRELGTSGNGSGRADSATPREADGTDAVGAVDGTDDPYDDWARRSG